MSKGRGKRTFLIQWKFTDWIGAQGCFVVALEQINKVYLEGTCSFANLKSGVLGMAHREGRPGTSWRHNAAFKSVFGMLSGRMAVGVAVVCYCPSSKDVWCVLCVTKSHFKA